MCSTYLLHILHHTVVLEVFLRNQGPPLSLFPFLKGFSSRIEQLISNWDRLAMNSLSREELFASVNCSEGLAWKPPSFAFYIFYLFCFGFGEESLIGVYIERFQQKFAPVLPQCKKRI